MLHRVLQVYGIEFEEDEEKCPEAQGHCDIMYVMVIMASQGPLLYLMYTVSQKKDTILLPITSANVNRFSKFFHWQTHW